MPMQENLQLLIRKCRLNNPEAHELIYDSFFDFANSISAEYSNDKKEQLEIIKLGFKKAFKYIHHFNTTSNNLFKDFQEWIRKMMIYAVVAHFRNNFKQSLFMNFDAAEISNHIKNSKINGRYSMDDIIAAISKLPASVKIVLCLTTIHGLNERELGQCLEIPRERAQLLLFEVTTRLNQLLTANKEIAADTCQYNNQEKWAVTGINWQGTIF